MAVHHWTQFYEDEKSEKMAGDCFWKYLRVRASFEKTRKIVFHIPFSALIRIKEEHIEFYLRFVSEVLNKDVYSVEKCETTKQMNVTIDCVSLNFNRYLVFVYLIFFRYFLEMPKAISVFCENAIGKEKLSPSELLISFLEQNLNRETFDSGCVYPNHCLVHSGYNCGLRPASDVINDLRNPLVLYERAELYFLRLS